MNQHTQTWLAQQPLWHNRDMIKSGVIGLAVGFLVGLTMCSYLNIV